MKRIVYAILAIVLLLSGVHTAPVSAAPAPVAHEPAGDNSGLKYTGGPDEFGYSYVDSLDPEGPVYQWIDATGGQNLQVGDDAVVSITLPFPFYFYGVSSDQILVSNNGGVIFNDPYGWLSWANDCPLSGTDWTNIIAPWWNDWDEDGDVYYQTFGAEPNRYAVIQWNNMMPYGIYDAGTVTFELILFEGSTEILFQYADAELSNPFYTFGANGTVGIRADTPEKTLQYRDCNSEHLSNYLAVKYSLSGTPLLATSTMTAPAYTANSEISYGVQVINTGTAAAEAATLSDILPEGTSYISGTLECSAGSCDYLPATNEISWTGGLYINESATLTYTIDTMGFACGTRIDNTATIDDPGIIEPVTISASTQIATTPPYWVEGFEGELFPPAGWTETIVYSDYYNPDWSRVTTGNNPPASPHSGAAMARFNSSEVYGEYARLETPALDFTAAEEPKLRFWMSHNSTNYYSDDQLLVQVSTDGGIVWMDLGAPISRTDPACSPATPTCWEEHAISLADYAGQSNVRVGFLGIPSYFLDIYIDDVTIGEPWSPCPYISLGEDQTNLACAGTTVSITVPADNVFNLPDTLNFSVESDLPASVEPASLDLPAGGTGSTTVSVYVPWTLGTGDSITMELNAEGQTSGLIDSVHLNTIVSLASSWTNISSGPEYMIFHSVVYYENKIYMIGSYYDDQTEVQIYDIASGAWSIGSPIPTSYVYWDCVAITGKIYCAGGMDFSNSTFSNNLHIYDIASDSWSSGATMPGVNAGYAGAALDGKYYVIGGTDNTNVYNTNWAYDPATDTWDASLPPMNTERALAMAGVMGDEIYIAGGNNFSGIVDVLEIFDPATGTWSAGTPMPVPLGYAADAVLGDRFLVVAGGDSGSYQMSQVWSYDSYIDEWLAMPDLPSTSIGGDADSDGTKVWIYGGVFDSALSVDLITSSICPTCVPVDGASFTFDPSTPIPGTTITFTANVTAGTPTVTYEWDFGDGATASGETVQHAYTTHGDFHVTLTATNCDGLHTTVYEQDMTVLGALANVSPLAFNATQFPGEQTSQLLDICSDGNDDLTYEALETASWLELSSDDGTVQPEECDEVDLTFDSEGMVPGIYTTTLTIETNDYLHPTTDIPVTLILDPYADLSITQIADPDPVILEESLEYTITVENWAGFDSTGAVLTDTLPAAFEFTSASPECTHLSGVVTCTVGPLAAGEDATFTITGIPQALGVITNTVTVTGFEYDPVLANNTASLQTEVIGYSVAVISPPQMDVTLHTNELTILGLNICNQGLIDLTYATDEDASWLSVVQANGTVEPDQCDVVDVTFNSTGMAPDVYTTTLTVETNDPANPSVEIPVTLTVDTSADLAVTMLDAPDPAIIGDLVEFTITVENEGPFFSNGSTVIDTLPPQFLFVSASPNCTHDINMVSCSVGALAMGESEVMTITLQPQAHGIVPNTVTVEGDDFDPNPDNNSATTQTEILGYPVTFTYYDLEDVVAIGEDVWLLDDFHGWLTEPVEMTPNGDYSVFTVTTNQPAGTYGYKYYMPDLPANQNYDMLNTNNRSVTVAGAMDVDDYRNVVVGWAHTNEPLDITIVEGENTGALYGEVYIANVTNPAGAGRGIRAQLGITLDGIDWTWADMVYSSDAGNNDIFTTVITPTEVGVYTFTVRFDGNFEAGNPNTGWTEADNSGTITVESGYVPSADLSVSMTDAPDPVGLNQLFNIDVTVANAGPDTAAGAFMVTMFDPALTFVSSSGDCEVTTPGMLECNLGDLSSSGQALVTITFRAPAAAGVFTTDTSVTSSTYDPDIDDNDASVDTTVQFRLFMPIIWKS